MRTARAFVTLWLLSFRRLFWSIGTPMLLLPIIACVMFLVRRNYGASDDPVQAFHSFSIFLLTVFASFLVPLGALAFGTAGLGGDREDRTLLFLFIRPLPRGLILLAKYFAALPLVLGFTVGSLWLFCKLAGAPGRALRGQRHPLSVHDRRRALRVCPAPRGRALLHGRGPGLL